MQAALRKVYPAYKEDFSLSLGDSTLATKRFLWTGVDWTPAIILHRMLWILVSLAIAVVASFFFHRFDPSRAWSFRRGSKSPVAAGTNGDVLATAPAPGAGLQPDILLHLRREQEKPGSGNWSGPNCA